MRTKTLLLSVAALLAAGFVTTQAQPVYSQNVVGYANIVSPSAYTLLSVPFNVDSVGNNATNVFGSSLPDGTEILLWNGSGYTADFYNTYGGAAPYPYWFMADGVTPTNPPDLPPGQGFFMLAPGGVTNTFAGTIAVDMGATNTMTLPSGYALVGSVIPYAGAVTNQMNLGNPNGTGGSLPDGTETLIWNGSGYTANFYNTYGGAAPFPYWFMSDGITPTNPPSLNVGQGMFILAPGGGTWQESLQ